MTLYTCEDYLFEEIRLDTFPTDVADRRDLARSGCIWVNNKSTCYFCNEHDHDCSSRAANVPVRYKANLRPPSFLCGYVPPPTYRPRGWLTFNIIQHHTQPLHKDYVMLDNRLKSFTSPSLCTKKKALAEAGFFYKGNGVTCCYHCGLVLRNWLAQDDPWLKHIYWYRDCYHVILLKGLNYVSRQEYFVPAVPPPPTWSVLNDMVVHLPLIQKLLNETNYDREHICKTLLSYYTQTNGRMPTSIHDAVMAMERGTTQATRLVDTPPSLPPPPIVPVQPYISKTTCICCQNKKSSIIYFSCGHMVCCETCSLLLTLCPCCNTVIQATCQPIG